MKLPALSAEDFKSMRKFIHAEFGIRMPEDKKAMLEARLHKRLKQLDFTSFREYCDFLFSPQGMPKEIDAFLDQITTGKTEFLREVNHFKYLKQVILPDLYENILKQGEPLKVWSAGCATGEEPYSLAMVLSECQSQMAGLPYAILGSDLSRKVLEHANLAIYSEDQITPIPMTFRKKYLLRHKDKSRQEVRIVPELRRQVFFRQLNFMNEDYGLDQAMHIIFCRNVIIYFDQATQIQVIEKLCRYLVPGGYLFIGHSETLNGLDLPLTKKFSTIYTKNSATSSN